MSNFHVQEHRWRLHARAYLLLTYLHKVQHAPIKTDVPRIYFD
jgi:hypothetical protein